MPRQRDLRQDQVPIHLIGVSGFSLLADQNVSDPHSMGSLSLQSALVSDAGLAIVGGVIHKQTLFQVLSSVSNRLSMYETF